MQHLKRGNKSLLLDKNEVYTLERVVDNFAMSIFDDYISLKRGEENSNGEKVEMETLKEDMRVLEVLSNALIATKR